VERTRVGVRRLVRALPSVRRIEGRMREGLGRLVPTLLCGEESSVLVFSRERDRLCDERWSRSRTLLARISAEEEEHALLLRVVRDHTPPPGDLVAIRSRSRRLLTRIGAVGSVADHFARISELDACVCMVMSELLATPLRRVPAMRALLRLIRSDERRHVRVSRAHVRVLGQQTTDERDARDWVRGELIRLLAYVGDSLEGLSVDPDVLFRRIRSA
jgi:hypothetical protein